MNIPQSLFDLCLFFGWSGDALESPFELAMAPRHFSLCIHARAMSGGETEAQREAHAHKASAAGTILSQLRYQ